MPVMVYWIDGVHGSRMPVTFYGTMKLIYWYAFVVYWIVEYQGTAYLLSVKRMELVYQYGLVQLIYWYAFVVYWIDKFQGICMSVQCYGWWNWRIIMPVTLYCIGVQPGS